MSSEMENNDHAEEDERAAEDVVEGVKIMGGFMVPMRKVLAFPPPDSTFQRRLQCFDRTGNFCLCFFQRTLRSW